MSASTPSWRNQSLAAINTTKAKSLPRGKKNTRPAPSMWPGHNPADLTKSAPPPKWMTDPATFDARMAAKARGETWTPPWEDDDPAIQEVAMEAKTSEKVDPRDVDKYAALYLDWPLTDDQRNAYVKIVEWATDSSDDASPWFNLRGFAGTGKTTLVQLLTRALSDLGFRVIGLAPTHKAVQVLASKVTCDTSTIHASSGLKMEEQEDGTRTQTKGVSMILRTYHFAFVDECSMVGRKLVEALQDARGNCRILTLGDPAQFNPVGEMSQSVTFKLGPKVVLKHITRQAEGNPLIRASKNVRLAIKDKERVSLDNLREWLDPKLFLKVGRAVPHFLKLKSKGYDVRILAYRNKTVVAYNQAIHYALYPKTSDMFCVGEPVMAHEGYTPIKGDRKDLPIKNSFEFVVRKVEATVHPLYPEFKTWRLELGKDLEEKTGFSVAYVPWDEGEYDAEVSTRFDKVREFESGKDWYGRKKALKLAWDFKKQWALIRHAHALTLHKSQGSTLDYGLIDFDDTDKISEDFEFNRALYVGLTRPRFKTKFLVR